MSKKKRTQSTVTIYDKKTNKQIFTGKNMRISVGGQLLKAHRIIPVANDDDRKMALFWQALKNMRFIYGEADDTSWSDYSTYSWTADGTL